MLSSFESLRSVSIVPLWVAAIKERPFVTNVWAEACLYFLLLKGEDKTSVDMVQSWEEITDLTSFVFSASV